MKVILAIISIITIIAPIVGTIHLTKRLDKNKCDSRFIIFTFIALLAYIKIIECAILIVIQDMPIVSSKTILTIEQDLFASLSFAAIITLVVLAIVSGIKHKNAENKRKADLAAMLIQEIDSLNVMENKLRGGEINACPALSSGDLAQQYSTALSESKYVQNIHAIENAMNIFLKLGDYNDAPQKAIEVIETMKKLKEKEYHSLINA